MSGQPKTIREMTGHDIGQVITIVPKRGRDYVVRGELALVVHGDPEEVTIAVEVGGNDWVRFGPSDVQEVQLEN